MNGSGVKQQELGNSGAAQKLSATAGSNASSLYGTLDPTLSTMATAPQGITPADMSKIQTSNMQTAGGANAGAVGQGSLLAARTKNAGTADAAVAKSDETAADTLSKANLGTQIENQSVKQQQQQEGLKGLGSLYGTNESEALGGLNASDTALHDASQIQNPWAKLAEQFGSNVITNLTGAGGKKLNQWDGADG